MNGSLDDQPRDRKNTYRVWDTKFVVLPILIAVALIGMAITHPHASKWISDAVQAEFVGMELGAGWLSADTCCPAEERSPDRQGLLTGRNKVGAAFDREFDINQPA